MPWYCYVSGDPVLPSSYIYCGTATPPCFGGPILCAVFAMYSVTNNFFPEAITPPLYADIIAALLNEANRGNALVKS